MATSKDESAREDLAAPGLETRRTHEATATTAESRQSIDKRSEPEASRPNVAIYLIEREAIQLRRMRWAPATGEAEVPDDRATPERAIRAATESALELLVPYSRPEPSSASTMRADDAIGRLRRWLRETFGSE